ncbi:MAG: hypothetical protein ACLR7U_12265 [Ruthenibacterium lactatiformans]
MENEAITAYRQRRAAFEATFERHLAAGVVFYSADGILIDDTVEIAPGAVILPGTILRGETKIGAGSVIGPNSLLENVTVGENVKFNASQGYDSVIESGAAIGPFAHIRPDSRVCENVHIGDFVEIKNSTVGKGTSVSHLTYVGDSDVGKYCNFGCGVVCKSVTARPSTATPSGIMRSSAAIRTWWRPWRGRRRVHRGGQHHYRRRARGRGRAGRGR